MGLLSNLVKSFFVASLTTGALMAGTVTELNDLKTLYVNQRTTASIKILGISLIYVSNESLNPFNVTQGIMTSGAYSLIDRGGAQFSYITSIDHLKYALETNREHNRAKNPENMEFIDDARLMIIDSFDKKKEQELNGIIDVIFSKKEPVRINLLDSKEALIGSFVTEEKSSDIMHSKQIALKNSNETLITIDVRPTLFSYKSNYTVSIKSDKVTMTQALFLIKVIDTISGDDILHSKGGKKKKVKAFAKSLPLLLIPFGSLSASGSGY